LRRGGEEKAALGGGLMYEVTPGVTARIDYAYEQFGRLQNVHKFGISLIF
jgi:opacity protein-like surface antigen